MGYLHTRRYIIDAKDADELVDLAIQHLRHRDDDEAANDLKRERQVEGAEHIAVTASEILTCAADVGDCTDVVMVLDEMVEDVGSKNDVYFEAAREAHAVLVALGRREIPTTPQPYRR
jgi:hypothetical protein